MEKMSKFIISLLCSIVLLSGCGNNSSPTPTPDPPVPPEVLPTELVLSFTSKTLEVGESDFLEVTVLPENATNKNVTFTVADTEILSCLDGLILGGSPGTTTVTVTSEAVPSLSEVCTVTVTEETIKVTSMTLSDSYLTMKEGSTHDLVATVKPTNATDKRVTYESKNTNVATVSNEGKITAVSKGSAEIVVTSLSNTLVKASCIVNVYPKNINAYLVDEKSNVSKIEQDVDGTYVEVSPSLEGEKVTYSLEYGLNTRVTMVNNGYYEPTGMEIDGVNKNVDANKQVTFVASVDDPLDEQMFFISLKAKYKDNTPIVGEYTFAINNSTHISLDILNSKKEHITSANQNDIIYIKPTSTLDNYVVKTIIASHTTYDVGPVNKITASYDESSGLYTLKVPFCYSKVLTFTVTEKDTSAFKDSDLVGTYIFTRTYGISVSKDQQYIDHFNETQVVTFDEAGEIVIGNHETHSFASKAKDGVIEAMSSTSSCNYYYGTNIMIIGTTNNGYHETPLATNKDIILAVKLKDGTERKDYTITSDVIVGPYLYYFVTLNGEPYASCYADVTNKKIVTDITYAKYYGEQLTSDKSVFDIKKDDTTLLRVGYIDEGGALNRVLLTDVKNLYTNDEHTLIFTSNGTCLFDDVLFTVKISELNTIKIDNVTHKGEITLSDSDMKFTVKSFEEKQKLELDIANKVFTGTFIDKFSYDDPVDVGATITFGDSNENITGTIVADNYLKNYWKFTGTFDDSTNILTLKIVDRGYGSTSANIDSSLNKEVPVQLEDQKLTIKSDFTSNWCYYFLNAVFTCSDFHI